MRLRVIKKAIGNNTSPPDHLTHRTVPRFASCTPTAGHSGDGISYPLNCLRGARLIGSIVIARTWQATTRRARIPRANAGTAAYKSTSANFLNLAYPHSCAKLAATAHRLRSHGTLVISELCQSTPKLPPLAPCD
jgi:hypothetical protein